MAKVTLKDGVLQFRHPLVKGKDGAGKIIRRSFLKIKPTESAKILEDVQSLLDSETPELLDRKKLHKDAIEAFFSPLIADQNELEQMWSSIGVKLENRKTHDTDIDEVLTLRAKIIELEQTILALQARLGEKSEVEKRTTISTAFLHFAKTFRTRETTTAGRRDKIISSVKTVCEAIGMDKRYSDIKCNDILDAIASITKGKAPATVWLKKLEAKTFFKWIAKATDAGGLAFTNPAETLDCGNLEDINKKRIAKLGGVQLIAPATLLALQLPLWQKALIGLCGYAGLRLSEAAALKWSDIDYKSHTIRITANEAKPELKTISSYRTAPFFADLVPILEAYKKESGEREYLFYNSKGGLWLEEKNGYYQCNQLSTTNILAIKKANGGVSITSPAKKLRAWYATEFKIARGAAAEAKATGHSKKVADTHYINQEVEATAQTLGLARK